MSPLERGLVAGYRSGLEEAIAKQLAEAGVAATYEQHKLYYLIPARKTYYKPDFILPNGIVVESKGQFVTKDRTKHRLIREQYPDLDIRFVFSNPNTKIGKRSKTTYAMWCERLGIKFAKGLIPTDWLQEELNDASITVISQLLTKRG